MADIYTTEAQSQLDAETNMADRVKEGTKISGNVVDFIAQRVIDTADTDSSADVLHIIKLPVGARVLPHTLNAYTDDPGTSYVIDSFGDLADANRYIDADTTITAAGRVTMGAAVETGPLDDYRVGDDAADTGWLTATLGAVTATAGKKITFVGQYVIKN